jgi:hypothetical protein
MQKANVQPWLVDEDKKEEPEVTHPTARREWFEQDSPWESWRPRREERRLVQEATSMAGGWRPRYPAKYIYPEEELAKIFRELADRWRQDTIVLSSLQAKTLHPAYLRIIGLGLQAMPFILKELQVRPGQWFVALRSIAGEDPLGPEDDFPKAIGKWMRWGVEHGYIVD